MSDTPWTDKHQWLSSPINMVVSAEEVKQFERDCNAKIAALEAENAALREDAERYQKIRQNAYVEQVEFNSWAWRIEVPAYDRIDSWNHADFDADVDRARKS